MQISLSKKTIEPKLRILAEDQQMVAAVAPELESVLPASDKNKVEFPATHPLVVSSKLPEGVQFPSLSRTGKTDYEKVKIIVQEFVLPSIGEVWPSAKPYVKGVQALWASKEFYDAITDETADLTEQTIKGVKAAQKLTNTFLHFQNASSIATTTNSISGYLIATADSLYVVRDDGK